MTTLLGLSIGGPLFSALNCIFLFCILLPVAGTQESIDFEKEIVPIFRQHCFECHGEGNTEGELSLESVAAMFRGGHTGSPILAAELSNSELYLRITSLSEGYRMPKKGNPLPARDIDKIGKWIQQVAMEVPAGVPSASEIESPIQQTSSDNSNSSISSFEEASSSQLSNIVGQMEPAQLAMFVAAIAIILILVSFLFYRMTASLGKRKISTNMQRTTGFLALLIGIVSSLLLVALGYFYWRTQELAKENHALRAELSLHNPKMPQAIEINEANLPLPPHPMHLRRLGGQYYRGNDERDESLYNGGFYRTATFDLHLVGANGKRLKWGDQAGDDLSVEISIQRAPNATKELFSQRVLNSLSLQHYCQTNPTSNGNMKFEVVEEDELWTVRVPLPKKDQWETQQAEGMIYLMYGIQPGKNQSPRPHFAVRYELILEGEKISNKSELWMGSMYTLGNRVLVPDDKKILLDRWFDWRPIPVIEGEASTDPKLLGIEEHLKD